MKLLSTKSIYYKDVNIVAQRGYVLSRADIPKKLDYIIVSPMSAVCGSTFVRTALELGLSVCVHRFCDVFQQLGILTLNDNHPNLWYAIGLDDMDRFRRLLQYGARNFVIDTANGYLDCVVSYVSHLIETAQCDVRIMVGNIHSAAGMALYDDISNLWIRIGIGNGEACKTSSMTAVNRGQFTEITECWSNNSKRHILIADGGISIPSYAAIAFGAGADRVMMGGYFARAEEAENVIKGEYKFWGSASYKQMELAGKKRNHSEGKEVSLDITQIKPLKVLVDELWGGIASAISYSGFTNLDSFIGNAIFELKN